MSSSGGSAAIREAIENKRAKIKAPGESLKTLSRDAKRKKAWWTEKIHIACLDEDGEPAKNCAWKVPRHHLTPIWLETMCLKCPMHVKVDYLKDQTTGDIVWPPDAQMKCHTLPWRYAVVAVEEKAVVDFSRDPFYYGDVRIMIFNVPLKTNNDGAEVSAEDITAWLLCGLLEEDDEVKEAREILVTLEAEAKTVEHSLSRVGYMKFTQKSGFGKADKQLYTDEEQAAKRMEQHDALSAQRDKMEEDVTEARALLESILKKRANTPVNLERASVQTSCGTCTYYVDFPGFQGARLEDIVCAKTDWPGIKLATKHDGLPPWAGRGDIPDGSKSYIPRYTEHAVNMRAAQICRLQHGFGQHKPLQGTQGVNKPSPTRPISTGSSVLRNPDNAKTAVRSPTATGGPNNLGGTVASGGEKKTKGVSDEEGVPFAGKEFCFYHGEFQEGFKSASPPLGFGMQYTGSGVYYGEYKKGRRSGAGILQGANGDRIEGTFVSKTRQVTRAMFPEAQGSFNPYAEGVCHGPVEIQYGSGGCYKGEMKNGRITGKGEFVSCLGERYSGDFVDGRLHGAGSVIDVVGQVWEGLWHEGEMDGEGRHSAPEMGEMEGDWVKGELQGKGTVSYKGGNTYEGFFLDNGRTGPGTLFRGNVKSVYDPRSGKNALRSNRVYEGTWRASELRPGSMVSLSKAGVTHCAGPNKAAWYNRAIDRTKRRETQVRRQTVESLDFYGRYETVLRTEVEKKKTQLYARQAKLANQVTKQQIITTKNNK
eukprot:jgi/Undpi1/3762/HiC_scaffold_16.g07131.m1